MAETPAHIISERIRALKNAGQLVTPAAAPNGVQALSAATAANNGRIFGNQPAPTSQQPSQAEQHLPFSNLTICVVTCDEHKHFLADLWYSVNPLLENGAQVVVVQTVRGNTEKAEVLNNEGYSTMARYTYSGIFNYGRAKNIALDCVLTEWVLFLDSDERLCLDLDAIKDVINTPNLDAAYCKVHSVYMAKPEVVKCTVENKDISMQEDILEPAVRIFKPNLHRADGNHELNRYRFTEGIHEQVWPSIIQRGGMVKDSSIRIHHVGYKNGEKNFVKTMKRLQGLAAALEVNNDLSDFQAAYNLWALFCEVDTFQHLREYVNSKIKVTDGRQTA